MISWTHPKRFSISSLCRLGTPPQVGPDFFSFGATNKIQPRYALKNIPIGKVFQATTTPSTATAPVAAPAPVAVAATGSPDVGVSW